jgi:hypothetical protein
MLTVCWAAKGGSGTTFVAAALALTAPAPTLLVDLAGDLALVLGIDDVDRAGVGDWLASDAPADRLDRLGLSLGDGRTLVPLGDHDAAAVAAGRWAALGRALRLRHEHVIVDAGTGDPSPELLAAADQRLLGRPTGIVLVDEPGRRFGATDIEWSLGAPIVATVLLDPAIARAVDSGLLVSRLPRACTAQLARAVA